jgi:hypothetical protein
MAQHSQTTPLHQLAHNQHSHNSRILLILLLHIVVWLVDSEAAVRCVLLRNCIFHGWQAPRQRVQLQPPQYPQNLTQGSAKVA